MAAYIKDYPVRSGVAIGATAAINFYVMPPNTARLNGCMLIPAMAASKFKFTFPLFVLCD